MLLGCFNGDWYYSGAFNKGWCDLCTGGSPSLRHVFRAGEWSMEYEVTIVRTYTYVCVYVHYALRMYVCIRIRMYTYVGPIHVYVWTYGRIMEVWTHACMHGRKSSSFN